MNNVAEVIEQGKLARRDEFANRMRTLSEILRTNAERNEHARNVGAIWCARAAFQTLLTENDKTAYVQDFVMATIGRCLDYALISEKDSDWVWGAANLLYGEADLLDGEADSEAKEA